MMTPVHAAVAMGCAMCEAGNKATATRILPVIDPESDEYKGQVLQVRGKMLDEMDRGAREFAVRKARNEEFSRKRRRLKSLLTRRKLGG